MITATILGLLLLLLVLGMPIGFAMAVAGSAGLYLVGGGTAVLGILTSTPYSTVSVFELLTIPMFLLMGELVLRSGIADDLFRAVAAWVGRVPGGLGMATAIAGAGFGAVCGSSTASAATLSSTSLPAMLKHGYEPKMAAGVVTISGTLAMLIPPSIALIIYGLLADLSIAKLLIAGIVPGILVTLTIILTTYILAKWRPETAPLSESMSFREKISLLRVVGPIVALMFCVTVAIYTGITTPTEASALGALGATIIFFLRGHRGEFFRAVARATRTTCMIALILIGAHIFGTFFALTQVTQGLIAWVGDLAVAPWVIAVVLIAIYLVLGAFMDQVAILVLTVPVVVPLVGSLGFDQIWFGVIIIVTAELGMVTPPVGLNCFVVSKYAERPLGEVFAGIVPHVIAHFFIIAILLAFPILTLWLPNQM